MKGAKHKRRKKRQKQIPFMPQEMDHPQAKELEAISRILGSKSTIYDIVLQDISKHQPGRIYSILQATYYRIVENNSEHRFQDEIYVA
ncbi:MAG: hypothetical protein SWH68_05995 [Thermodesulfobacteriota bacterium]|nr:hypothetical protein [Thermodesulfobacteriota bacterium]